MSKHLLIAAATAEPWLISGWGAIGYLPSVARLLKGENFYDEDQVFTSFRKSKEEIFQVVTRHNEDQEWEEFNYYLHGITPSGKRVKIHSYSQLPSGSTAVIPVKGALMASDQYCGPMGMETMGRMVTSAENSTRINHIVLEVDSPGGQVKGTQQLANIINGCETDTTAICTMACSAAYWIASSCDSIIATAETAKFGSIGVMIELVNTQAFFEKEGIEFHTIMASQSTDKNREFLEAFNGEYELIRERTLDPICDIFIENVRQNKNPDDSTLTGFVYLAKEAISLGLVDSTMSEGDSVIQVISQNTNQDFTMSKTGNLNIWQRMFGKNADKAADLFNEGAQEQPADNQELIDARAENDRLTQELAARDSQINDLNATITEQNATIARLEALPAADHTSTVSEKKVEEMAGTERTPDQTAKELDDKFAASV